jgi:hypothetical protein
MNFEKLSQSYLDKLNRIERSNSSALTRIHSSIKLTEHTLNQLRKHIELNGFKSMKDEIYFFRNIKPILSAKLIYLKELGHVEYTFPKNGLDEQNKFINRHLSRFQYFFNSHIAFGQYIEMECTHLDQHYFTRKSKELKPLVGTIISLEDPNFSTPKGMLLAQFKAYGELVTYLRQKQKQLTYPPTKIFSQKHGLKWAGNKIDLIELIYALHASGSIKGATGIKQVAEACEELFDVDLGNYYRKFIELRNRKLVERTHFLDTLKSSLIRRMEEADD